jgi:hypothetical protein
VDRDLIERSKDMVVRRWGAAACAALVIPATATPAPAASGAQTTVDPTGQCQVVQLKTPPGTPYGSVMDIEQVAGETVYYGSMEVVGADGVPHQRAVLWRGLDGEPQVIDTGSYDADIALELTSSGLANGQSEDWTSGRAVAWVYELASGELAFVDTGKGRAEGDWPWVRRINEHGAMAGVIRRGVGRARSSQAVGWGHFTSSPVRLQESGELSQALGINDLGERAGLRVRSRTLNGKWHVADPVLWDAHGEVHPVAKIGLDGVVRGLTEDRQMAGFSFMGPDPAVGFLQATYWASPDEVVGLGVLDGGGWSDAFGIDDTGWVVGGMDRIAEPGDPYGGDWGIVQYNFLWTPDMGPGRVRILPSPYALATGIDDWQKWALTHAAHAVNAELDQVGAGSHVGFSPEGWLLGAPTVYVNASQCGQVIDTTQDPWHLTERAEAQATAGVTGDPSRPLRPRR